MAKKIVIFCIILNIFLAIFVLIFKNNLPPIIPLYYGLPVSNSILTPVVALIIPSVIAIALGALNLFLANLFKDKFLENIFTSLTVAVTALSVITTINIIFLVGKI